MMMMCYCWMIILMQIKYLSLPIYSIAVYGQYIYFSGGGGGSTGIPNQILIYHKQISKEPTNTLSTHTHLIENLTICQEKKRVIANANDHVIVYAVEEQGKQLQEMYRFKADFKSHYPTINAIGVRGDGEVIITGGDDSTVRFYQLKHTQSALIHQYSVHSHPIKTVDHNSNDLYASCDSHLIAICNLTRKQIVRRLFQDQLQPTGALFQASYFEEKGANSLVIVHYLAKERTFVTKQTGGKLHTKEVSSDQCCKSTYNRSHRSLGVACGRGATMMWDCKGMSSLGTEQHHKQVVLGCTITRKNRLITGTSACSYHIQGPSSSFSLNWSLLLAVVWTGLVVFFLGSPSMLPESTQL